MTAVTAKIYFSRGDFLRSHRNFKVTRRVFKVTQKSQKTQKYYTDWGSLL